MAIIKKPYEISVWDEKLGEYGQKTEIKKAVIGANDISYIGRATLPKLTTKINGTHILTFQMPSKFFDNEKGEYVHNEFCDYLFNERKVKLKYNGEWYEFYVKNITENKQHKSIMYQYTCEDAFIDELSRNGYGITFDTELYNNVEELGTFTEIILDDSIWEYDATKNWGDFTEYSEEKLFKIPVSMFSEISGYKLNYIVDGTLTNVFSGEKRPQELGDDISREQKIFWDNGKFDKGISLLGQKIENIENDGYIYVPYSCLDFCYVNTSDNNYAATQKAEVGEINNIKSYYLSPSSIDPTFLIQFIALPFNSEVQIDESGLLINKDYTYVMTLSDWNKLVKSKLWYNTEKNIIQTKDDVAANKIVCYDGYLEKIKDTDLSFGKKISITDRTEINISEDINQYIKVYNNSENEYKNEFTSEDWVEGKNINYRICSSDNTRVIVPQLARNLVQNGTKMADTSGWEVMKLHTGVNEKSSSISVRIDETKNNNNELPNIETPQGLIFDTNTQGDNDSESHRTFINFGIVGQEETISKEQTYILHIDGEQVIKEGTQKDGIVYKQFNGSNKIKVIIGEGNYDKDGDYTISENRIVIDMELDKDKSKNYLFIRPIKNIENPYFAIVPPQENVSKDSNVVFNLKEAIFAKAYTKGIDFFEGDNIKYKYTGRDIFFSTKSQWSLITGAYYRKADENEFLRETDVVEGDTYTYKKYFRQQIQAKANELSDIEVKDTFMLKSYLNNDIETNGFDPTVYTEDDLKVVTDYIDLNKCSYYNSSAGINDSDCTHKDASNGVCMYQKYGYCPYRFQTQKHCRKVRTLNGEKSNRFNLTQELSKIFEVYPVYYIEHEENGKVKTEVVTNQNGNTYQKLKKKVFYITEKGTENKLGFKYTKNLSNISRTFNSKEIVTKLYVEDIDSELSKTGLCSIKTAEDNPSKDNYIIDFSYYTMRGLLDKDAVEADLYGKDSSDMGYLKQLGYYNSKYDELSNLIINLQDESYNELAANIEVNLTGIETAQQELNKINKNLSRYISSKNSKKDNNKNKEKQNYKNNNKNTEEQILKNDTYLNYKTKYTEQKNILLGLIEDTFMTNGKYDVTLPIKNSSWHDIHNANELLEAITEYGFKAFKKDFLDNFKYKQYGLMGQYTEEYLQIQKWKKERAAYLKDINRISLEFYRKYEPYLKEGTWSDSNYLNDNYYYFGAKEVAKQGAIPKLTYSISVIDLSPLDSDYQIAIADTTYIEDEETFGINDKTGLPNRLKVIVSEITNSLDIPTENSIQVQNYTTQFEDLFQQISASVQSLTFNENIYKRSSNFTATKNISEESLQGGLSENQLTLIETDEKNIELDSTGQSGSDINNHANKYKLSGEGLFFSNNGGQTWNVGVTPKGINADYIKVGSLDASKISIVDGEYLYFLWDKGGITAYRTPGATKEGENYFQDFARFNKYGLSLVEGGKIKLRAGYSFIGDEGGEGEISSEKELTSDNDIGFYLYNNKGEPIFETSTAANGKQGTEAEQESARIKLSGEMYVTDTSTSIQVKVNSLVEFSGEYTLREDTAKVLGEKIAAVNSLNFSSISEASSKLMQYKITNKKTWDTISSEGVYISGERYSLQQVEGFESSKLNEKVLVIETSGQLYEGTQNEYVDYVTFKKDGDSDFESVYCIYRYLMIPIYTEKYSTNTSKQVYIQVKNSPNVKKQVEKVKISSQKIDLYIKSSNAYIKIPKTLYYPSNGSIFTSYGQASVARQESTEQSGEGSVGLYINNKNLNSSDIIEELKVNSKDDDNKNKQETLKLAERLFCCGKKVNKKDKEEDKKEDNKKKDSKKEDSKKDDSSNILLTSNIFTILKTGELFFGGYIKGKGTDDSTEYVDIEELPAKILIEEPYAKISEDGFFIDFANIKDIDGQTNLIDYISGEIAAAGSMLMAHSHEVKTLHQVLDKNTGTKNNYIYYGNLTVPSNINKTSSVTWNSLEQLFNAGKTVDNVSFSYQRKVESKKIDNKTVYLSTDEYKESTTETAGSAGAGGYMVEDPVDKDAETDKK